MRNPHFWWPLVLLVSCATAAPRSITGPSTPPFLVESVYLTPSPSWPLRQGPLFSLTPASARAITWQIPSLEIPAPVPVPDPVPLAVVVPAPLALPLPEIRPIPVKQTPVSRSWTSVTQAVTAKPANLPLPQIPVAIPAKTENKVETKAPPTVVAKPQPVAKPAAVVPPTPAASAALLPTEKTASADFRWEDVNAVAGDAVTLHFDKTNWLYLDSPAQQKALGFQSINREKDATTFQFKPLNPGLYTLEFQRQDLVNQTTDLRKVRLLVVTPGTRTSTTGTTQAPQTSRTAANDALEASRQLAASGKTAEAVQRLLQSYKADDARVNLELAKLLNQGGQDDEALTYLEKNLTLTGPDFQSTLELGTRLSTTRDPQKKLPAYVKLWSAGTTAPPEELFVQVFETLRTQKMPVLAKDWSSKYGLWYPVPKLKDRYLYQQGQLLEEPGEHRDIRGAWKSYNEVVQSHPLSPYWKMAGERAAYLNRTFLQVR